MDIEEVDIAFRQAVFELGEDYVSDFVQRLQHRPKNPTMYVTKEYYDIIKKREESKLDEN